MPNPPAARPTRAIAWVDGRVLPASEATVPLLDPGFLRGDAVFDAMLVRAGRTHARDAHLARLRASAKAMGIRVPAVGRLITDLLAAWGEQDGALKVVVTRAGNVRGILSATSWPETMSLHAVEMPWGSALSGVKTLSYAANQWALRRAQEAHADDALIVTDGVVQELPTGTVIVITDGVARTPDARTQPILHSVTLDRVRAVHEVTAAELTLEDVHRADELLIVSATRPVIGVHAVDEVELDAPGPITASIAADLSAHIDATLDD